MELLNLQKGVALNLTKADGSSLSKIRVGMSWDVQAGITADLDLFMVQKLANGEKTVAYFGAKTAIKWVKLGDDNLTGAWDWDDEFLEMDATQTVDGEYFVCVNIYTSGVTFDKVANPKVTVYNSETNEAIATYSCGTGGAVNALLVGKIVDNGDKYTFTAMWDFIEGDINVVAKSV